MLPPSPVDRTQYSFDGEKILLNFRPATPGHVTLVYGTVLPLFRWEDILKKVYFASSSETVVGITLKGKMSVNSRCFFPCKAFLTYIANA
ncbi:hypothetical protein CDAR_52941 [Caerostris darwini]|uniref:Uncharacterized protein n=1 Tax=Caerostris darwini TaxID=1538125 RepID=A0AAV4QSD3_9ARAC|nr:hypothetical protein CDAR_52941 [Caerostris darwini]